MDIGESRFTFKCLACGAIDYIGGAWLGTGTISRRVWERTAEGCRECGAPMVLYEEEMRYDWEEYGLKNCQKEYDEARALYLEGRWMSPPEPPQPQPLIYYEPTALARFIDRVYDPESIYWKVVFCCGRGIRSVLGVLILCALLAGIGECMKFFWRLVSP